jgi:ATP-binding cassette subfamily B protein
MAVAISRLKRTTAVRLLACVRAYPFHLAMVWVVYIAGSGIILVLGQGVKTLIDHGLHGGGLIATRRTLLTLLVLVIVYAATSFGRVYFAAFIGDRVNTSLNRQVIKKLLEHGPGFFETEGSGLLWSRASSDIDLVRTMLISIVVALRNLLIVLGGLAAMMAVQLLLTAMVFVMAPVIAALLYALGSRNKSVANATQLAAARANALALEVIDGIRMVKAYSQERFLSDQFENLADETLRLATRRNLIVGVVTGVSTCLIFGWVVLLVEVAAEQVIAGRISEGQASAFMFYALVVATSGANLSDTWSQLQRGVGAAERVFALIDQPALVRAPASPARLARSCGTAITFDGVSFRYPKRPEAAALEALDLDIEAGAVTALVGPSGAGKSTVFQLLIRLYDPDAGRITIGGLDLRRMDPLDLRAQFAIVPQEPTLFEGDLMENIRFGRRDASDREVEAAAEAAQAMEFVARLPHGLRTEVGSRGVRLSGGQRQRIAIARAILRDPRILLLDEATNALDARSEALAHVALTALAKGRTTLVIAHKLSTVRTADQILVMESGRLVAKGSHASLLAEEGLYARLAELQRL